eukprot:11140018-Alexandrium_andersonii.AAC.1
MPLFFELSSGSKQRLAEHRFGSGATGTTVVEAWRARFPGHLPAGFPAVALQLPREHAQLLIS